MKNIDSTGHVSGTSVYLDDLPMLEGTLFALAYGSPVAHGRIIQSDLSEALAVPGVVRILSADDIPGENQIGGILPDEPFLAGPELHYRGQPVFLIVAENEHCARKARKLIRLEVEPLPAITDVETAFEKGSFLFPPRTFALGDVASAWDNCTHIFEGVAQTGGQEHLYLETQGAYAWPLENGSIKLHSATQGPTLVQRIAGQILGLPMHKIEVETSRLGGAFGGKEDQATAWACMAALAAWHLNRPVKITLHRLDDLHMTGKRHPYRSHFRIGLDSSLKIRAYEVDFLQDGGAAADLSPAILERTLFHTTNAYFIPNIRATAYSCKTNVPPNTAFRGFGGPQAMFVIESAIALAAEKLRLPARKIQEKNLLKERDEFPYGQIARNAHARKSWAELKRKYRILEIEKEIAAFNRKHPFVKKGMACMPVCFGISFTKTPMNQASALVHIYQDGSVGLSSGAVEMGQGVNTKLVQVAASALSIYPGRIRIEPTDTTRVANTSPTAASSGADLNGKAVQDACRQLKARLLKTAGNMLQIPASQIEIKNERIWAGGKACEIDWVQLVAAAFLSRVNLSAQGHYATPLIHFDKSMEKGHPFAYHVYGTAAVSATVDCLRGIYEIDAVDIVHDFGNSLNHDIDMGQMEGGLVQGIGWMTCEEVSYNAEGKLLSGTLSTYKLPDLFAVPEMRCTPLDVKGPALAILRSKAVGEPPFMYGIGAYFAIRNAIRAFRKQDSADFISPLTPEQVLMSLHEPVKIPAL